MRNLIIDTSKANMKSIAGLHWQVAQATSIYNVQFWGSKDRSKEHIGICKVKFFQQMQPRLLKIFNVANQTCGYSC